MKPRCLRNHSFINNWYLIVKFHLYLQHISTSHHELKPHVIPNQAEYIKHRLKGHRCTTKCPLYHSNRIRINIIGTKCYFQQYLYFSYKVSVLFIGGGKSLGQSINLQKINISSDKLVTSTHH